MPSDDKNKKQEEQADGSLMNDEELESVSGGCQWGDTMGPKFPGTTPIITPTLPTLPTLSID